MTNRDWKKDSSIIDGNKFETVDKFIFLDT